MPAQDFRARPRRCMAQAFLPTSLIEADRAAVPGFTARAVNCAGGGQRTLQQPSKACRVQVKTFNHLAHPGCFQYPVPLKVGH